MSYATILHPGPVHVCRVTPLDSKVVRLKLSVKIPHYGVDFSDTELGAIASLITTGTKTRTKQALEAYQKRYGISLSVTEQAGILHFGIAVLEKHMNAGLSLLSDILFNATLPDTEFKLRIQTMLEMNREAHDDAKRIVEINFRNTLYPKESYFHEETLAEERAHINSLKRSKLIKLYNTIPNGEFFITLVGDPVLEKKLMPFLKKLRVNAMTVERPCLLPNTLPKAQSFVTVQGKTNVEVRMGNRLPITTTDDEYLSFSMGLTILGKPGSFMGRLMSIVREKEGLTYGIYARTGNESRESTGHWYIFTFFAAKDLKKGLASTKRELKHLVKNGVNPKELATFKEIIENQLLIAHGSDTGRVSLYHNALLNYETPADILRELALTKALTCEQVNAALKKFIKPEQLIIAGAGPVDTNGNGIV